MLSISTPCTNTSTNARSSKHKSLISSFYLTQSMKVPINSYHSIPKPLYRENITFATFPANKPNLGTLLQEELHRAVSHFTKIVSFPDHSSLASQETLENHNASLVSGERLDLWDIHGSKSSAVSKSKGLSDRTSTRFLTTRPNSKGIFTFASNNSKIGILKSTIPASANHNAKSQTSDQYNGMTHNSLPEIPNTRPSPDELNVEELTPPDLVREFKFREFNCKSRRRFRMRMEVVRPQNHEG